MVGTLFMTPGMFDGDDDPLIYVFLIVAIGFLAYVLCTTS